MAYSYPYITNSLQTNRARLAGAAPRLKPNLARAPSNSSGRRPNTADYNPLRLLPR
jgi:hypothetical protein